MDIAKQVRSIVDGSGMSLTRVSKEVGTDCVTLWRFMRRGGGMEVKTLQKLCDYFGYELKKKKEK